MILDERFEFCDATSVALTAAATPQNIGDVIDLSVARDIGVGMPLYLVVQVDTTIITAGNAGTIQFQLVSDATGTIATNNTATVHGMSPIFVTDGDDANDLHRGDIAWIFPLPMEGLDVYERYLAVQVIAATTNTTAGAVSAFLTPDVSKWKAYDSPTQA